MWCNKNDKQAIARLHIGVKVTSSTAFVCMSAIEINRPFFSSNGLNGSDLDSYMQMRYGLFIIVIKQSINPLHWM